MEVRVHSSSEPLLEYNASDKSKLVATFLTNLGHTGILCNFRLVPERKEGKEIPES